MDASHIPVRRGRPTRRRLDQKQVVGLPQLRFVEGLLGHLRQAYDHPNRQLHFDDLFIALLLAFYNPVVRSLRGMEDASQWEHLLSESRNGMLMQFYVALIGTLLLAVATGRKPDRYSFNLLCLAAAGHGSVQDALAILQRRHAERDRDRQRRRQRHDNSTP